MRPTTFPPPIVIPTPNCPSGRSEESAFCLPKPNQSAPCRLVLATKRSENAAHEASRGQTVKLTKPQRGERIVLGKLCNVEES